MSNPNANGNNGVTNINHSSSTATTATASATGTTNAFQDNANASNTVADHMRTSAPHTMANGDVKHTSAADYAHNTAASGSTITHSTNVTTTTSQGNSSFGQKVANATLNATTATANINSSSNSSISSSTEFPVGNITTTQVGTDSTASIAISPYQPAAPLAQPSACSTAQSANAVFHSNVNDTANWISDPYPKVPAATADTDAAASCASLVRNAVIDSMHEDFPVGSQAAVAQHDTGVNPRDSSGFLMPSMDELNEILQHIDGTNSSNQIKVCWCLGTTYNYDPDVRSLLESWLKSQLGLGTPTASLLARKQYAEAIICFLRKNASPHKFDEVLRLAQEGGYHLPEKFQSWLQLNSRESVNSAQISKLSSELSLKEFECTLKAQQADLSAKVLSYWLVSSEDESSRFSFLSNNFKRFTYFAPAHQPIVTALFEYCKGLRTESPETGTVSHQPFSYPSFVRWACEHYPQGITKQNLEALAQYKDSLSRRRDVFENMQHLYETSWRLQAITSAKTFINEVRTNADYTKCRNARNDFIVTTNGVEAEQTLGIADMHATATNVVTALTDKDKRWQLFVPTGYKIIDDAIQGYQRGGVTIFAASSGVGKTWFGIDTTFKLLEKYHGRALFFSSEMDVESITLRFFGLATNSKIGINDLVLAKERGLLPMMLNAFAGFTQRHYTYEAPDAAQPNLYNHNNLDERLRIYGNEVNGLTLSKIVNIIDEERTKGPIDLVVIDYLQNIKNDIINPKEPRHAQLTDTINVLKGVAQRDNCPVLVLAQLTNPSTWPTKKKDESPIPTSNNIAEASYAIQPAAAVLMMYKVSTTAACSVMDFPFTRNEGESFNFDPKDEEVFDENNRPLHTSLRLVITKGRFNNSTLQLNEPIFVERSQGSRFNFFL